VRGTERGGEESMEALCPWMSLIPPPDSSERPPMTSATIAAFGEDG
jgi:hypothetical protein